MSNTPTDILTGQELQSIVSSYKEVQKGKRLNAWNLFNLSSYNNQRENFHSDVIASLLDPNGMHKEGDKFLMLFIDFLNEQHQCDISSSDFVNSWVPREKGRIDIGIFNHESKCCIIIENKMNNATDQDMQIERYIDYARGYKFNVNVVVYLSLDGLKQAPNIDGDNSIVKSIPAFGLAKCLVNGWLEKCLEKCSNRNSSSFIVEYIKLVKQLAHNVMDEDVKYQFYHFVSSVENFNGVKDIIGLFRGLTDYRRDHFRRQITNYNPFKRSAYYQYGDNRDCLFEQFNLDGYSLKLDVWFISDGSAKLYFWVPNFQEKDPQAAFNKMTEVLTSVDMLSDFYVENHKYLKYYNISENDNSITKVDSIVLQFVNEFLMKLRPLQKQ